MSDTLVVNGAITDTAAIVDEIAAVPSGTHVGTATGNFTLQFKLSIVEIQLGQDLIADAALYAALNTAGAPISWST
jgi:hypothetical protein